MVSLVAWDQIIYLLKHYAALVDSAPCRPGFRGEKGHFENPKFGRPSYSTFFKMASRCFVPILLLQLVRTIILTTVAIIIPSHRLILFIVGVFLFHPALCSLCVTCCHYNQNGCHNLLTTCDLTGALCLSGNRPTNGNERAGCGKSETV